MKYYPGAYFRNVGNLANKNIFRNVHPTYPYLTNFWIKNSIMISKKVSRVEDHSGVKASIIKKQLEQIILCTATHWTGTEIVCTFFQDVLAIAN
jgi:hypothetical protein